MDRPIRVLFLGCAVLLLLAWWLHSLGDTEGAIVTILATVVIAGLAIALALAAAGARGNERSEG